MENEGDHQSNYYVNPYVNPYAVFVFLSHNPRQTRGDEMKTVQKPVMPRVEKAGQGLVVGPMWPI